MAEEYKIHFYPKPAPPTNPRVLSFNEIQSARPTNTQTRERASLQTHQYRWTQESCHSMH